MKMNHEDSGVSPSPESEKRNRRIVKMLFKALSHGDTEKVTKLLCSNLEWWFHGPPHCQYMMKTLTGESTHGAFIFRSRRIRAIGDRVIVEGWEQVGVYWVHVWGLHQGIIVQLREYFNTLLTIVLRVLEDRDEARVWQSMSRARVNGSLSDLVLAIRDKPSWVFYTIFYIA